MVERNARTRTGELDLIALDGTTLVFVEVKAGRAGSEHGPVAPAHSVGPRKQARIRRLAREWLAAGRGRGLGVAGYRFDVVGVSFGGDGVADVDHIVGAFWGGKALLWSVRCGRDCMIAAASLPV